MAILNFNDYLKNNQNTSKENNYIKFFTLSNDQDEAIVRFPYSSNKQFDLITTHNVRIGNSYKRISCLRGPQDPLENCPLCNVGEKVQVRFFCKLVQYVVDETGSVVTKACIWDRPSSLAKQLNEYINDYGDLSNVVFKVKRSGAKGDLQTTYNIYPINSDVYNSPAYAPNFEAFKNFDLSKFFCLSKTAEEMNMFLSTGSFPEKPKQTTVTQNNQFNQTQEVYAGNQYGVTFDNQSNSFSAYTTQNTTTNQHNEPEQNQNAYQINRPRRYVG